MTTPNRLPDPDTIEWHNESLKNAAASKPGREKRPLSPEMEAAINDTGAMGAHMRAMENAGTFGLMDRFRAIISGTSKEDQWEKSARLSEMHPWSSGSGRVVGSAALGAGASKAVASAIPALARNTVPNAVIREGVAGGGTSLANESIRSAQGQKEFDPSAIALDALIGGGAGAVGSMLPAALGHGKTIFSKTADRPLTAAQKAALEQAGSAGQKYNFTGDSALDLAQRARYSEDPGMAQMAANLERLKTRAGPSFREAQDAAFRGKGLDKFMESSVPQGKAKYPEMSGKAVGQTREAHGGTFQDTHVLTPREPIPPQAQQALDDAYLTRRAIWDAQQRLGTGTPGRPPPQRSEMKMWEDVLDPKKTPLPREDLAATRRSLATSDPAMVNRMFLENQADEVARIRNAIRNAPETPESLPETFRIGTGIPFINRSHLFSADVPIPKMPKRAHRAATYSRDPASVDIIGKLTNAQAIAGGASRGAIEQLIDELSGSRR